MRVPKLETFTNNEKISYVRYAKPVSIPRLPVITNERQRDKLVKTIEKYIRKSLEYKDLIKYLKENVDMNQCEFFQNVSGKRKKGTIQIHHEPFDLYTLTSIVMNKQEKELGYIDELVVAEEVMRLHYQGYVGLIPLSITAHELVHAGKLVVPLNNVYGRFTAFVREYYDYIDPIYISMLHEKVELTKNLSLDDLSILKVRYIYTTIDGFSLPEKIEEPRPELKKEA